MITVKLVYKVYPKIVAVVDKWPFSGVIKIIKIQNGTSGHYSEVLVS
jgi:hypothetical protein